jgi:hypothetical protein
MIYVGAAAMSVLGVVGCLGAMCTVMPDGTSATSVDHMFTKYQMLIKLGCVAMGLSTMAIIWFIGAFGARLWEADFTRRKTLSWIAYASDIMLMAIFFVEIGLVAASTVLAGTVDPALTHVLHVAAFTSAFILGPVWTPYFVATYIVSKRTGMLPGWLNKLLVFGGFFNFLAIFGVLSLSGPVNAENGIISLGGPVIGAIPWTLMAGAWVIVTQLEEHVAASGQG